MAEKPGVMLYFDMAESLKFLSREDKGDLLDAIMDYGRMGKQPDFKGALGVCWALIKPRMDRDTAKYEEVVIKKQYSSYCAALKRKSPEEIPLPYEDWLSVRNHPDAGGTTRFPTTISTPSTNKKSYLSTTSAPSITTKTERNDPGVDFEKLRQQKLEQLKSASFFTPPNQSNPTSGADRLLAMIGNGTFDE